MNARGIQRSVAVLVAAFVLVGGTVAPASAAAQPDLRLISAGDEQVELVRWGTRQPVWFDLGLFVTATGAPLQVNVQRLSYDVRPAARQVFEDGSSRAVDAGYVTRFQWGLRKFLTMTVTNAAGDVVLQRMRAFCPNGWEAVRVAPDAPDTSPFPSDCGWSPLLLGSVWGIQDGWATAVRLGSARIPDGRYTIAVSVADDYASFFNMTETSVEVSALVRTSSDRDWFGHRESSPGVRQVPAPKEPEEDTEVPGVDARPDLVASPAWSISTRAGKTRDWLEFAATVWNAGPANLVVDGYRQSGEATMDAYQSFYRDGARVGVVQTGTMVYDPRRGHQHWHFQDFAQYRLLDSSMNLVRTSGKEAFCVVPTDMIDITLPGAVWKPEAMGIGTSCGWERSLSLREVLPAGWGDTYYQSIPGQSINITTVPNGTYYLEVVANPDGRLYEVTTENNSTVREITIGGALGARTVTAKPSMGLTI